VDELNGKQVDGQSLYVARAQTKGERQAELRQKFQNDITNKYSGVNLYVKNLGDDVNETKLRAEFGVHGQITSAEVMRDEKGNSKGFGFVCFAHPEDANKAVVELNGRIWDTKPIFVTVAQKKEARKAQLQALRMKSTPGGAPIYPGSPSGSGGPPPVYFQQNQVPQPFLYPPPQLMHQQPRGRWNSNNPGNFPIHTGFIGMPVRPHSRASRGHPQQHLNHYPRGGGQVARFNPRGSPGPRGGDAPVTGLPSQAQPNTLAPENVVEQTPQVPQEETLTLAKLKELPLDQQTTVLGEKLFPLIEQLEEDLAGKITGMLLDRLSQEDNKNVLEQTLLLLSDPQALKEGVNEAVQVLRNHAVSNDEEHQ
jgi:polyadenylate-binding protein